MKYLNIIKNQLEKEFFCTNSKKQFIYLKKYAANQ